jgi:hypothetical protein
VSKLGSICLVGGALLMVAALVGHTQFGAVSVAGAKPLKTKALAVQQASGAATDTCNTILPPNAPAIVTPAIAHSGLPCSVAFDAAKLKFNLDTAQQAFDFNSWLTFVALNAPGAAARNAQPSAVWEGWQDLSDLMLPGGAPPPPFGTSLPAPAICAGGAAGAPVLRMISKTPVTPTVSVSGQPLNTGPLIDQNGNYARYQILVNRPMYDYIVGNHLYSKAGQSRFPGPVQFPMGATTPGRSQGSIGAIVIKASWKILGKGDDRASFQVVQGYVYTPAAAGVPATCVTRTLGLVGLHIVHKEANEPQWNWATFEHVGNAPAMPTTEGHFNFYNPSCGAACPINHQPPQPWNASAPPDPHGFHSQIVRMTQYPAEATRSASRWNPQFQDALMGSVLANYELVTTQWPTAPTSKTDANGSPFPLFAANTTMETYVQGNVPQASSSCMACHGNATDRNGKESDFSFILEKAR